LQLYADRVDNNSLWYSLEVKEINPIETVYELNQIARCLSF